MKVNGNCEQGEKVVNRLWEKIQAYDASRPRSLQTRIGPSEIGEPCERKLAFKLAGTSESNPRASGWAAIKGTALHAYMESVLAKDPEWITEKTLEMVGVTSGSSDALWYKEQTVVDHKFPGDPAIADVRRNGLITKYRYQFHIYGLGWEEAGYPVKWVCGAFMPMAGGIDKRYGWAEPYSREIALEGLDRYGDIEKDVRQGRKPLDFDKTAGHACTYCPFFSSVEAEESGTGCSGPLTKRPGMGPHGQFQ